MNKIELLKKAKQQIDALVQEQKLKNQESADEAEATKIALLLESNASIVEAVQANKFDIEELSRTITNAISQLQITVPQITVPNITVPEIQSPAIFIPEIKIPEIKIPDIHVPEPKVTVNVAPAPAPIVNIDAPIVNFPSSMDVGLGDFTKKNPLPVIQVDPAGNYVTPVIGNGGGGKSDFLTIKDVRVSIAVVTVNPDGTPVYGSSSALGTVSVSDIFGTIGTNVVNPDGRLKVELPTGSSSLTDTELRATSLTVNQLSSANWSVSVVDIFGSTATSMLNGDNRLRVAVDTGTSGLTDSELRATSLTVNQLSGAGWSTSVTDVYGTTATNLINPDGRMKVELPTGSSGLTDTELRASSVPFSQVSGAIWSTSIIDAFGSTAVGNVFNADNRIRVSVETGGSGLTDTELRASHLDVQQLSGAIDSVNVVSTVGLTDTQLRASSIQVEQVSGASWSTNVLTMPAVTVTSITNSTAVSLLNGDGVTLDPRNRNWTITETVPISSANTLDIKQVSGASDSVNVLSMPSVTVTSITNSTASVLIDSSGVQYSGSNPLPTKEVRSATPSQSSPSVTVVSTSILAGNTSRLGATIYNEGSAICYMKLGSTASLTSYTLQIASGGYYEVPFGYTGAIDGITSASTAQLRVTEIT